MMNKKWELFHKGMKRAEWVGMDDGLILEWSNESGLTLFAFFEDPLPSEIIAFSAGNRFEIAFRNIKEIGFFAFKFGGLDWVDCSFSPNLYEEKPIFDKPNAGQTYALHVMLINSSTGELVVLRSIALGQEFTEHFRLWGIESLKKNIGSFYYNRIVDEVFADFPLSSDIANGADIKWVCTHGEDENRREEQERL